MDLPASIVNASPPEQGRQRSQAKRMVRKWNAAYPSGTAVKYWNRFGDPPLETATRGEAFLSAAGVPVLFVERVSGYVSLFHVLPLGVAEPAEGTQRASAWLESSIVAPPIVAEAACDVEPPQSLGDAA